MIRPLHIGQNLRLPYAGNQAFTYDKVIQPPPYVSLPRIAHVAPPTVGILPVRIQAAEGIHKAAGQQPGHLGALLVGKAGAQTVGACVFDVDFLMGYVQVAAQDHRLFGVQIP